MNHTAISRILGMVLLAQVISGAMPLWGQPSQTGPGRRTKLEQIKNILSTDTTITLESSQVRLSSFTYPVGDEKVEALLISPLDSARYPGLLMVPGYLKTARDFIPLAVFFAQQGFATLSISQPGFGRSNGSPDFAGPRSVNAARVGLDSLRHLPMVDSTRIGALGYSRGAMVVGLLCARSDDIDAAVLGAGIYDLETAYRELPMDGIRENIEIETGATPEALRRRSLIGQADSLNCPVLIIHGGNDQNAPSSQAHMLKAELDRLGKDYEFKLMGGQGHSLNMEEFRNASLRFLQSHMTIRSD